MSAERVIGCNLASLKDTEASRKDHGPLPPTDINFFQALPSGKRLRSILTRTSQHKKSFFHNCSWPHQQGTRPQLTCTLFHSYNIVLITHTNVKPIILD